MRLTLRTLIIVPCAAAATLLAAPAANAAPDSGLPECVNTGGAAAEGGSNTECATPGNVQIDSTPGEFNGPWGNMWDEDGLFFP